MNLKTDQPRISVSFRPLGAGQADQIKVPLEQREQFLARPLRFTPQASPIARRLRRDQAGGEYYLLPGGQPQAEYDDVL